MTNSISSIISDKELLIELTPVGGRGGQYAGVRPYVMRATHIPTGVSASIDSSFISRASQYKVRKVLVEMLEIAITSPNIEFCK